MDERLNAIAEFIPINSRVADIGTDHAYLAIELINRGLAEYVIASDKNAGPLEAAKKNIRAAGLEDKIDVRIGDGLKPINVGEVNVICIAGMGGALICEILSASPEVTKSVNKIILQPMNAVDKVREWVEKNNFCIEDEDLAEVDGIIYEILCISNSGRPVESTKKAKSPLLKKFIQNKIDKLQRVINEMSKSAAAKETEKFLKLKAELDQYRKRL